MNYIIIETQTTNGVTAVLTEIKSDFFKAEAEYHRRLSAAAESNVPIHSVTMITERGNEVDHRHECYVHETGESAE